MKRIGRFWNWRTVWGGLLVAGAVMAAAQAGWFRLGGTSWKEEVRLHDGRTVIVERWVKRGGRHEIGQPGSYVAQTLKFALPGTSKTIEWEDPYSKELGSTSFLPMLLDIVKDIPYLVVDPMGCQSYNKWGRPNPPYVIFKYENGQWIRIPLQELPAEITTPNLLQSAPDMEVKRLGTTLITAEEISKHTAVYGYRGMPEYQTILREPLPASALCPPELRGFKAPYPIKPDSDSGNKK